MSIILRITFESRVNLFGRVRNDREKTLFGDAAPPCGITPGKNYTCLHAFVINSGSTLAPLRLSHRSGWHDQLSVKVKAVNKSVFTATKMPDTMKITWHSNRTWRFAIRGYESLINE